MKILWFKSILATILAFTLISPSWAKTASSGKVTFLGTLSEKKSGSNFYARFRFRLTDSKCDGVTAKTRWVHVNSGRGDGKFVHNMANLRNAYGTLMAAQLAGKRVQVGGLASCDASKTQTINLWSADIGIY